MVLSSSSLAPYSPKTTNFTKIMSFQSFTSQNRPQNQGRQQNQGRPQNRGRQQNRGRGNRNRNTPAPRQRPVYVDIMDRSPHQVVGSAEWGLYQRQQAIMEGRQTPNLISETPTVKQSQKNTVGIPNRNKKGFKDTWTSLQKYNQTRLIDQIVNYTNSNEWSQISGGEHDKKWVNPRYDDNVFETGRIVEKATGDVIYFPISNMEDDPAGIAMHYKISPDGSSYTIYHNGFTAYGNAKDRKYWKYLKKRRARLGEQYKKNKEIEDENLRQERLQKYGPEKTAELERIDQAKNRERDITQQVENTSTDTNRSNTQNQSNTPNQSNTQNQSNGLSMRVTERGDDAEEVIMFTGPTPEEALMYDTSPKSRL